MCVIRKQGEQGGKPKGSQGSERWNGGDWRGTGGLSGVRRAGRRNKGERKWEGVTEV